jgi:TDG/mug DNA glycosylase family protein
MRVCIGCVTVTSALFCLQVQGAQDDHKMPGLAGVGFTDVGSGTPGTDSSEFSSLHFAAWRPVFFERLAAHAKRASQAAGCACGRCGAPAVVAFSGKRQFAELFQAASGRGRGGRGKKAVSAASLPAAVPLSDVAPATPGAAPALPASSAAAAAAEEQQQPGTASPLGSSSDDNVDARLPSLQAQRPARLETGRQWVLPEGWPLPLTTEVRRTRVGLVSLGLLLF